MPQFRKKPVIIEAVRFDPTIVHRFTLPTGVTGYPSPGADNWAYAGCKFWIDTLEGRLELLPGEWVITGVKGERYPCKDDIFRMTYEPVGGDGAAAGFGDGPSALTAHHEGAG